MCAIGPAVGKQHGSMEGGFADAPVRITGQADRIVRSADGFTSEHIAIDDTAFEDVGINAGGRGSGLGSCVCIPRVVLPRGSGTGAVVAIVATLKINVAKHRIVG